MSIIYKGITIIVPVFNEGKNVVETIKKVELEVKTSHEIVVVYETESEPSLPDIKQWAKDNPKARLITVANHQRGLVGAMKTAFGLAKFETVVPVAADGSEDTAKLDEMYSKIQEGAAIVSGTRYGKGGRFVAKTSLKKILSQTANKLVPVLMGLALTDLTYAYKLYRTTIVRETEIESTGGFEYAMELTLKTVRKGEKVVEVPVVSIDRAEGVSKFQLKKWLGSYLKWYWWGIRHLAL